jgi:hypothetical protein
MISQDLLYLSTYLHGRSRRHEPLTEAEMDQLAATFDAWLPQIQAMEGRVIPPGWRVVEGGRCPDPPRVA